MATSTTAKTPKLTKAMKFEDAIALLNGGVPTNGCSVDDCIKALEHEIELLAKKNTSDKKPTAVQQANMGIQSAIIDYLTADPNLMVTVTDIMKNVPACAELSNQKVTSMMTQLSNTGKVVRTYEKRKAFFSIAH